MENYAGLSRYIQYNYKGHNERKRKGGVEKWCDYESTHEWCFCEEETVCVCVCVCVCVRVTQSCLTLCDSMDCILSGSSVHGILQARTLEWVATTLPEGEGDYILKKRVVSRHWKRQINVFCLRASRRNVPQHISHTVSLQRSILDCWISELSSNKFMLFWTKML